MCLMMFNIDIMFRRNILNSILVKEQSGCIDVETSLARVGQKNNTHNLCRGWFYKHVC